MPNATHTLTAADILDPTHPLHRAMVQWTRKRTDTPLTKRKARKFLTAHPQYKTVQVQVAA